MGHTAAAFAILESVVRSARPAGDTALESLALSTRASLLRQAGRHVEAAGVDGHALAVVGCARPGPTAEHRAAILDGLVGLAADHLGQLHLGATRRLLGRARELADDDDPGWMAGRRPRLRIEWVTAELAMYAGDGPGAATHADAAVALCRAADTPVRHVVKTMLISAAAAASAGDVRTAVERAAEVTERARAEGLLPLEWAALALRHGLDPADAEVGAGLSDARAQLVRHGVPFVGDATGGG
ncbi:hypothetical protein V1Y59_04760 [Gordonia sp. PKS22-38]|uniref:LuxR family transcriptional regulator n=1 Tax=Gordonia prachuapensis TaxID=3115651 RepID=A0ABU7MPX2_9ACTN|nr:hypothetical protein [Gordonia sp. PKS22-38]